MGLSTDAVVSGDMPAYPDAVRTYPPELFEASGGQPTLSADADVRDISPVS